jgi:hypothetical protein
MVGKGKGEVNLEEVEVRGDVSAWVLDGHQLVEGDDHELLLVLPLICFFKGGDGEVAGGGLEGGAEPCRRDGARGEEDAGLPRRRTEKKVEVEVVVDGGRHGHGLDGTQRDQLACLSSSLSYFFVLSTIPHCHVGVFFSLFSVFLPIHSPHSSPVLLSITFSRQSKPCNIASKSPHT